MQDGKFKVAIVGCGRVGMAAAFAMLIKGGVTELVLWGRDFKKVMGEKMDLDEAQPLMPKAKITATDSWKELGDCDLIVFSAGAAQRVGQTRLELAKGNKRIVVELMEKVALVAPEAVVLMVTNPVDVLTWRVNQLFGVKKGKIFGSGTMLDTMRFRYYLAQQIEVDANNVHAYVLGEHGDHSFPVYENAVIGGQKLLSFPGVNETVVLAAYEKAKDAAGKIIAAKGATWWAIGMVIARIALAIRIDERVILPLSVPLQNYRGISGVALSVPCKLGKDGIEEILEVDLSSSEEEKLKTAVEMVRGYL